jgi:putative peptidoglycan lipid II flippase
LGLRLRPHWRFANPAVKSLAVSGLLTVVAQQVATLVALRQANAADAGDGPGGIQGTALVFTVAQTVYLLPWAVLAVPAATAAYPTLAESAATGDTEGFQGTLQRTARGVMLLSCLGAALLAGVAGPAAAFLSHNADPVPLAWGLAAYAPGLIGYGLAALLSRALYARNQQRAAAMAFLLGWGTAVVAMPILSAILPATQRVAAIGLGTSIGMTVLGAVLTIQVLRSGATMPGLARAGAAGLVAALVGAAAGNVVRWLYRGQPSSAAGIIALGAGCGVAAVAGFAAVALALDGGDLRALARRRRR